MAARVLATVVVCVAAAIAAGPAVAAEPAPQEALPAPQLTATPPARTNISTPTFRWSGTGAVWDWTLTRTGDPAPLHLGTVDAPLEGETALPSLPDGDYVFRVAQRRDAQDPPGPVAEHAFSLDATPPAAVRVVERPPFPTTGTTPSFGIADVEPGASALWTVIAAGGALVQGPSVGTPPTVALAPLTPGSYVFQIRQDDAFGNAGPTTTIPFAIVPAPAVTPAAAPRIVLPKLRATRMRPRASATIPTLRPLLRWAPGPRRTTLYNVQIFRVGRPSGANATSVGLIKVRSSFPRTRWMRANGLVRGRCYVWRVWPYVGAGFAASPLGVSHFCVSAQAKSPAERSPARRG